MGGITRRIQIVLMIMTLFMVTIPVVNVGWSAGTLSGPVLTIHFKSKVFCKSDQVTLSDLADTTLLPPHWVQRLETTVVGEAPPVGSEKYIQGKDLEAYMRDYVAREGMNPNAIVLDIPDHIVVRRATLTITKEKVEKIYRDYILDHAHGNPAKLIIKDISFSGWPVIPLGKTHVTVKSSLGEKFLGIVPLSMIFEVNGRKARTLRVTGRVILREKVVCTTRNIPRNQILGPEDIILKPILISDGSRKYITDPNRVYGMRALHNLGADQPIISTDIGKPILVRRGKNVTIVYKIPGLQVTAKGKAHENGGAGDRIRVENIMSHKVLMAQVYDPETVVVYP